MRDKITDSFPSLGPDAELADRQFRLGSERSVHLDPFGHAYRGDRAVRMERIVGEEDLGGGQVVGPEQDQCAGPVGIRTACQDVPRLVLLPEPLAVQRAIPAWVLAVR